MKHNDSDSMYDPDASLARIDAIATAALSSKSLTRYEAYKQVLLAREQRQLLPRSWRACLLPTRPPLRHACSKSPPADCVTRAPPG